MRQIKSVALIGFGEVGQVLAADLSAAGIRDITAYDPLFAALSSKPAIALRKFELHAAASAAGAALGADLVISAVTAAQSEAAARSVVDGLDKAAFFLDLNSASPAVKCAAAATIEAAGGRYVEAAVMAPIGPRRIATPLLLGGPHMEAFLAAVAGLGFSARAYSAVLGRASATKMCRSVMVKGVEALVAESLLAARYYGVEADVLGSLANLLPADDWEKLALYMLSRSLEHGRRRAEEMREVARTVAEAGIEPWMSRATAERQDWAADRQGALKAGRLDAILDTLLQMLAGESRPTASQSGEKT